MFPRVSRLKGVQARREAMKVTRRHPGEQMVFGMVEHVETQKIEPPSSLSPRERSAGIAIVMDCPDREKSGETFSHKHRAEMELQTHR